MDDDRTEGLVGMDTTELFEALERIVEGAPSGQWPHLLGELERIKAVLWRRLLLPMPAVPDGKGHRLLTMQDVAKQLALPESRVYELARQGKLPTVRIGKYVRVEEQELENWVASQI